MREPVTIHPRKPLSPKERAALFLRDEGRCYIGGEKIDGPWEDEHVIALCMGGTNDLENRAVCCPEHHAEKTRDDRGRLAKCKRIEARENGTRRPRKKIPSRSSWAPSRKLQSRGFGK